MCEGGIMAQQDLKDRARDKEEEYFYKVNKELIDRKRKQLNEQRGKEQKDELKMMHWMCCPKCGHTMEEINHLGIIVDRCTSCSGIYFDKGELEILLESKEQKGFLSGMKKLFT
jgi:Zn-finger nucleic acid-binding protein